MKILQLHNCYQIRGGEEGVVQAERELLIQYGHQVEQLEVSNDDIVNPIDKALTAVNAIYSWPAKQQVTTVIKQYQPDIVHVHNFFPRLSPSIYDACIEQQVPVVQTLHNYRLGCVKAMLFRENQICEVCLEQANPWAGIKYGCYRDSKTQSAVAASMLMFHRWRGTWTQKVDAFIALTDFQRQKMTQAGLPSEKIHIKPNFVASITLPEAELMVAPIAPAAAQPFVLFVGRLSIEKGITVVIEAYRQNNALPLLKIVGDGPERSALEAQVMANGLNSRIQFFGYQPKDQIRRLMQQAIALIFPSIWYEGFPLTIVEALSCGLPPLVSRLGSMTEIIQNNENGLHFEPGDSADLAVKIERITQDSEVRKTLAVAARQTYEQYYTSEQNYAQLMAIYHHVLRPAPNRTKRDQVGS
jgi:glycosyltransferase involved in cell wall biosynthesis